MTYTHTQTHTCTQDCPPSSTTTCLSASPCPWHTYTHTHTHMHPRLHPGSTTTCLSASPIISTSMTCTYIHTYTGAQDCTRVLRQSASVQVHIHDIHIHTYTHIHTYRCVRLHPSSTTICLSASRGQASSCSTFSMTAWARMPVLSDERLPPSKNKCEKFDNTMYIYTFLPDSDSDSDYWTRLRFRLHIHTCLSDADSDSDYWTRFRFRLQVDIPQVTSHWILPITPTLTPTIMLTLNLFLRSDSQADFTCVYGHIHRQPRPSHAAMKTKSRYCNSHNKWGSVSCFWTVFQ